MLLMFHEGLLYWKSSCNNDISGNKNNFWNVEKHVKTSTQQQWLRQSAVELKSKKKLGEHEQQSTIIK